MINKHISLHGLIAIPHLVYTSCMTSLPIHVHGSSADDILTEESVAYGVRELKIPVVQCAAYGIVPSGETGLAMQDGDYSEVIA